MLFVVNWENPEEVREYNRIKTRIRRGTPLDKPIQIKRKLNINWSNYKEVKEYRKIYQRKIRSINLEREKKRNRVYNINKRIEIYELINTYRDKPCKICNKKYPIYCMDFHHNNSSTKLNNIVTLTRVKLNKNIIIDEIKKCEILCANCHININGSSQKYPLWFIEYKSILSCERCKINKAIEFHHKDRKDKIGEITKMVLAPKKYSKEIIMKEIEKCQVLCRNCHRIIENEYHKSNST